jgi:hypothetical protein
MNRLRRPKNKLVEPWKKQDRLYKRLVRKCKKAKKPKRSNDIHLRLLLLSQNPQRPLFHLLGLRHQVFILVYQIFSFHRHISDRLNILEVLYYEVLLYPTLNEIVTEQVLSLPYKALG